MSSPSSPETTTNPDRTTSGEQPAGENKGMCEVALARAGKAIDDELGLNLTSLKGKPPGVIAKELIFAAIAVAAVIVLIAVTHG